MRVYLPATLDEVSRPDQELSARYAYGVTDAIRMALPQAYDEELEAIAQLAAGDASVLVLASAPEAPHLRVVVAADVADSVVGVVTEPSADPTTLEVRVPVRLREVASLLVDEPAAAADVAGAMVGDEAAFERLWNRDLLWYDVSEIGHIPRQ